jgi:hypothetical protein
VQPALQAADVFLHSATQAPDNPQFMAQENPFVSQRAMHWAAVSVCASRSFPDNVPARPDVAANKTKPMAAMRFMAPFLECVLAVGKAPIRQTCS